MIQGGASRRESIREEDKRNEDERGKERSWGGAATHVLTCPTLHWASDPEHDGPEARTWGWQ
jgi:hypothetical protein